jgi:hypothetical protein
VTKNRKLIVLMFPQGISKLLAVDPMAKEAMADLLLPHLQQFIDDGIPPLKLESCAYLQVPSLTHLVIIGTLLDCQPHYVTLTESGMSGRGKNHILWSHYICL